MPKIRRQGLPEAVLRHLLKRVRDRSISERDLVLLARWLDSGPEVPEGRWYRHFSGFVVCGQGELIKTFLLPGQLPSGTEV